MLLLPVQMGAVISRHDDGGAVHSPAPIPFHVARNVDKENAFKINKILQNFGGLVVVCIRTDLRK